jgi:hypothetical protein
VSGSKSAPMTKAEANEALYILAKWFEINRPFLVWSIRTTRGRASWSRRCVKVGPKCWRGTTDSLLHEFAHLFAMESSLKRYGTIEPGCGHGPAFWHAMHMVAAAWCGDPSKYGWATEYRSGFAYARREGIYKPEPSMLEKLMTCVSTVVVPELAGPKETACHSSPATQLPSKD